MVAAVFQVSQRRLSEAEDQIETLLERSKALEELASDRLARLEEEVRRSALCGYRLRTAII